RVDDDTALAAGDRARARVGGGERAAARGLEGGAEAMDASVGGDERVVGRQGGLAVAAAEAHGAEIAGGGVAVSILGGDGDVAGRPRRARRCKPFPYPALVRCRVDDDAALAAGDRARARVGGGQRLAARG